MDSLVFVNKDSSQGTKANKKTFLNKYQILRKELGIMLNDSFLIGDINLIVEGNTEKLAFHRLFSFEKYQELEWVNIYNADGVPNIPQAINYLGFRNLNLSGIVILDSDEEAEKIKAIAQYKNNISQDNWEKIEINSVFNDKKKRTFEDLFPQNLYVEAFNQYCHSLSSLDVFETGYQDLSIIKKIVEPIIDAVSKHYKSFLASDSKSTIAKQDVIRILLDNIENINRFVLISLIYEDLNETEMDLSSASPGVKQVVRKEVKVASKIPKPNIETEFDKMMSNLELDQDHESIITDGEECGSAFL